MATQRENSSEEVKRLRRCINDLVSILALPAMWTGQSASQIVVSLLDALVSMLTLDFAYVRVANSTTSEPFETVRTGPDWKHEPLTELSERIRFLLGNESRELPSTMEAAFDGRAMRLVPLQMGLRGEVGVIVAGSQRADFAEERERLVLTLAANQAAIGLREAGLLSELDRRVAQRTSELTAKNEELRDARAALQKAHDELQRSEAWLGRVIDTIPTLAWTMLPDGSNEFLSKRWHEYTGRSIDESRGWGWQAAFHPDDLPALLGKWQELLASGQSGENEARLRRFDGVYRWFLIRASPFHDETGTIVRWYGTSTDIEDRKRAEEALLASERNLSLTINAMPVLAWSAQADGNVDFLNRRWLDYTGLTAEQARGWGWVQAFHPDDLDRLNGYWQSIIAAGQPGEIEGRLRRFDGMYRWFLVRASPLRDHSGTIVKWYGTNTDIDDRKRAEEELSNTQAELARVMRVMAMGQLTASIAHEVNQPLSGIVTNASTCLRMLDADPPNLEGARETARRTIRDGNRASNVVTRLRTLYSKKEIVPEQLDLNDATREVLSLSMNELQRNGVILRQDLAEDLPPVVADRIQIQQVVLNLVRNGSDAMSTIEDRTRELWIRTEVDESGGVRFSVKDVGVGIDAEIEDKLFEAFYTTKRDGMGVGLSVSRSIIESHQGHLWATRNDGPGTTFTFVIPRSTNT